MRADSTFCTADVVATAAPYGAHVSLTTGSNPSVDAAIATIPETAWTAIRYPGTESVPGSQLTTATLRNTNMINDLKVAAAESRVSAEHPPGSSGGPAREGAEPVTPCSPGEVPVRRGRRTWPGMERHGSPCNRRQRRRPRGGLLAWRFLGATTGWIYPYPVASDPWEGVRARVRRLRRSPRRSRVFGADGHRFALHPPLTEVQVTQAEAQFGTTLPAQYRSLLTTVGAGGAGPGYGLFALARDRDGRWTWQSDRQEATNPSALACGDAGPGRGGLARGSGPALSTSFRMTRSLPWRRSSA